MDWFLYDNSLRRERVNVKMDGSNSASLHTSDENVDVYISHFTVSQCNQSSFLG